MYYDLIDYFDVWGNETEGWQVNNLCKIEEKIFIDPDSTDEEIIKFLIKIDYLCEGSENLVYIESCDSDFIEIFKKDNNLPIGRLEKHIEY